jgi:hypothetical protein
MQTLTYLASQMGLEQPDKSITAEVNLFYSDLHASIFTTYDLAAHVTLVIGKKKVSGDFNMIKRSYKTLNLPFVGGGLGSPGLWGESS